MSSRSERRLLCLRRHVPADREQEYRALWSVLASRVAEAGSHAWRFAAPGHRAERLEFLEFEAVHDPRGDAEARGILGRLNDEIAVARVEEWLEDR